MMNDPILKCLLVEVGQTIAEIEYTTPRHEIVRVLDEATQKIAELGIRKKAAPVARTAPTKPVLQRPRKALLQRRPLIRPMIRRGSTEGPKGCGRRQNSCFR